MHPSPSRSRCSPLPVDQGGEAPITQSQSQLLVREQVAVCPTDEHHTHSGSNQDGGMT